MKKVWMISHEVNRGEYGGYILVTAEHVEQIDTTIIVADGVQIDVVEKIDSIDLEDEDPEELAEEQRQWDLAGLEIEAGPKEY